MIVTRVAPAKLNLFLHITGRRADGYHLLESQVAFLDLADTLTFERAQELSLALLGDLADALRADVDQNIILQAARALQAAAGVACGARITVNKRIPVAAGLGGGSADAAATLLGLAELWNLRLPADALYAIAKDLGSDVPVCLGGVPAIMRGVGDQLTPVDLRTPAFVVLINPGIPLPTADVYRQFRGAFDSAMDVKPIRSFEEMAAMCARTSNRLEPAAISLCPVIAEQLAALREADGCFVARMAGSGATCFGLFEHAANAKAATEILRARFPQAWIHSTLIQSLQR